jgi:quercetin dioxygenase-like cupin family protein
MLPLILAGGAAVDSAGDGMSAAVTISIREQILALQARMKELLQTEPMREQPCPLRHFFVPGSYAREIFIPKGTLVVGKIHRHAHINIVSLGRCSVMTEEGPQTIQAPSTWVSQPGTKRVVYAHEDTIWTTLHVTNQTDLATIEEEIIAPTYGELDQVSLTHDERRLL